MGTILEQDAGLHFLLKVDTLRTDRELTALLEEKGIRIKSISSYYHLPDGKDTHLFVVNYSVLDEDALEGALKRLSQVL